MRAASIKIFFLITSVIVVLACGQNSKNKNATKQNQESCLLCHDGMTGFSSSHDPVAIGCSSCHLGNFKSFEEDIAHQGMIKIPGNLVNASKTCSSTQCHQSELARVENSLMATNSGIVSIDKYAFEEISHTDTLLSIEDIHDSAADRHLKNLCYKCHLGYEKKHYGKTTESSRGGGCLACHLNYNGHTLDIRDKIHPSLDLNIGNDKCFGCHSRSGRISTNYEGWYETVLTKEDISNQNEHRVLADGRVFAKAEDDVHHKAGLSCIDCHSSIDVMGDGDRHKHESDAVKIRCTDCHTKGDYLRISKVKGGNIAALDYILRKYRIPTEDFIITKNDSVVLVNTGFDNQGKPFLVEKLSQKLHMLNPPAQRCRKDVVHNALDCNMCHTSWVTSCIGCHTGYDDTKVVKGMAEKGKWFEEIGEFNKSKPVMGVSYEGNVKRIKPAIPGMIMTLDKTKFKGKKIGHDSIFLRLFAPISAHTISRKPRSCKSCHLDSEALGYGKGILSFDKETNNWSFESLYSYSEIDSLPQDAWIGVLRKINHSNDYSAHQNFYPLDLGDQKKILKVGTCLYCHPRNTKLRDKMVYGRYEQMADKCKYYKQMR